MPAPKIAVVFHSVCANTYLMAREYRDAFHTMGAEVLFYRLHDPNYAVTADAFNNLSDAASSVVTLVGFHLAGQEADEEHPFGHGRMEYLAGLVVALLILLVGVELVQSSVDKILHPEPVVFSTLSAVILAVSIGVKLWMFWFNRLLSQKIQSPALSRHRRRLPV